LVKPSLQAYAQHQFGCRRLEHQQEIKFLFW
jgi:hypothetical protein